MLTADLAVVRAAHPSRPSACGRPLNSGGDYAKASALGASARQRLGEAFQRRSPSEAGTWSLLRHPHQALDEDNVRRDYERIGRTSLTDASGPSTGTLWIWWRAFNRPEAKSSVPRETASFDMRNPRGRGTLDKLDRSVQFERGVDNFVYHKGIPCQLPPAGRRAVDSAFVAPDGRRADIDVDYSIAEFPVGLFNGHLTQANSDVRAGNNYSGMRIGGPASDELVAEPLRH